MKLRRTLPSVTQYSANKRSYETMTNNYNTSNILERQPFAQSIQYNNNQIVLETRRKSQSPRKPIFEYKNRESVQNSNHKSFNFQVSPKKTVTFSDFTHNHNQNKINIRPNVQHNRISNKSSIKTDRQYSRRSIFKNNHKSTNDTKNGIIQAHLNIKQFSNDLKTKLKAQAQQKILLKITQLENKLNNIENKVISKQQSQTKQQISLNNQSYYRNQPKFQHIKDNTVLKLQLQQVRRCERIAKQNQILYGTLTKKLQQNSRIKQNSIQYIRQSSLKYQRNQMRNSRKVKITAFQDFQYNENKNKVKDQDQNQGYMQIVSPFLLKQNKGKISLF